MKNVLRFSIICLSLIFFSQLNAFACVCASDPDSTLEQQVNWRLKNSEAVFVGEAIAYKENDYAEFVVEKAWTDFRPKKITVYGDGGDCEYQFETGKKYLVYAFEWKGKLMTNDCQWNQEVEKAKEQLKILGDGKSPEEDTKQISILTFLDEIFL